MPLRSHPFRAACAIAIWLFLLIFQGQACAQEPGFEVSVGVGGIAKLGHWVPVQFQFSDSSITAKANSFRITALDGDDTPSTIVGPVKVVEDGQCQGVMQFGRTYGDVSFEVLDRDGNVLATRKEIIKKQSNSFAELIPSTGRLFASIELNRTDETGSVASLFSASFPGGVNEDDRFVVLDSPRLLPRTAVGFESCESLLLHANDSAWANDIPDDVVSSIDCWISNGGHLLIIANADHADLFKSESSLARFAPGTVSGSVVVESSRRLEEFCNSSEPFLDRRSSMQVVGLEKVTGRVSLQQGTVPLIVRKSHGLGEITFLAFDPTDEKFRSWSGSTRFAPSLMKLRLASEVSQTRNEGRSGSAVRHSGYDDLTGQLKVPLERFSNLRFIPFALIAALIALYILCIGVGDWFLVGRLLGRHEFTWVTFPLLATLFCGIAWFAAKSSRPSKIQINQVELIDIDSVSKHVRGTAWSVLYSPTGRTVDLGAGVAPGSDTELGLDVDSTRLGWLGLPGDGLGGMLNRANPGLYRTGYRQELSVPTDDAFELDAQLQEVKLQVSSTRPLFAQWTGEFQNEAKSRLEFTNRLEGTLTNPLNVKLKNCRLFFDDLVYIIDRLDIDETIDILSDTNEKTVRNYLTRKTRRLDDNNKSQSLAWDTRDRNVSRILDMMMFFHGAGGKSYTGLSHSFHEFIEMTPNASMNRAVLVGQPANRFSSITIDGESADENYDSSYTVVRVLLPVERKNENRKRQR